MFEAGTPNVGAAVGIASAIGYLEAIGHDALQAHELALTVYGLDRLSRVGGIKLFGPEDPAERTAVFSFEPAGVHPHDVASAYIYNTTADIDRLADALDKATAIFG